VVHPKTVEELTRMPSPATVSNVDGLTADRGRAITPFGFTERQARFLVTVMLHSGVFVGRQYAAFAGITHGQKVHDFVEKLLSQTPGHRRQVQPDGDPRAAQRFPGRAGAHSAATGAPNRNQIKRRIRSAYISRRRGHITTLNNRLAATDGPQASPINGRTHLQLSN
jgi:hypothetical protein